MKKLKILTSLIIFNVLVLGCTGIGLSFAGDKVGNGGFYAYYTSEKYLDDALDGLIAELEQIDVVFFEKRIKPIDRDRLISVLKEMRENKSKRYRPTVHKSRVNPSGVEDWLMFNSLDKNGNPLGYIEALEQFFERAPQLPQKEIQRELLHEAYHLFNYAEAEAYEVSTSDNQLFGYLNLMKNGVKDNDDTTVNYDEYADYLLSEKCNYLNLPTVVPAMISTITSSVKNMQNLENAVQGVDRLLKFGFPGLKAVADILQDKEVNFKVRTYCSFQLGLAARETEYEREVSGMLVDALSALISEDDLGAGWTNGENQNKSYLAVYGIIYSLEKMKSSADEQMPKLLDIFSELVNWIYKKPAFIIEMHPIENNWQPVSAAQGFLVMLSHSFAVFQNESAVPVLRDAAQKDTLNTASRGTVLGVTFNYAFSLITSGKSPTPVPPLVGHVGCGWNGESADDWYYTRPGWFDWEIERLGINDDLNLPVHQW